MGRGAGLLFTIVVVIAAPLVPPAAALSCVAGPTVEEIVASSTALGPITDPWALIRVEAVTPSSVGVEVRATVELVVRGHDERPDRSILIESTKDPMGSSTPMEDAVSGEAWLIPLRRTPGENAYNIGICSGAFRADDDAVASVTAVGEPPGSTTTTTTPPRSSTRPSDTLVPTAIAGSLIALVLGATVLRRRSKSDLVMPS